MNFTSLMVAAVFLAGIVHWILILVSFFLPEQLKYRENLAKLSPIIRQIFHGQHNLIVLVLLIFGGVCVFFPADLAGGSGLGRFLSAGLAVFWFFRLGLQLFYYDPQVRKENRLGDVAYTAVFIVQSAVFAAAALKGISW